MKILFLTNNDEAIALYNWLIAIGEDVTLKQDKFAFEQENQSDYNLVISYAYKFIIKKNVIEKFPHRIINLHISFLPWNRGADPNFWSFVENTPKGVTIHLIDEGIDTGKIIYQKKLEFNEDNETLKSSYFKLNQEIQNLFKEHWAEIKQLNFITKKQIGEGSIHYKKDFEKIKHILNHYGWDITIKQLKEYYSRLKYYENS